MKKSIIFLLAIFISVNTFSQLKVMSDGRIGIGILNPASYNKVSIVGGTLSCLNLDGTGLATWNQVCKSIINNANVMSYVVHSNALNRDVFYVEGDGDIYFRYGWVQSDSIFKSNILTIDNALNKVLNLRGVSYYSTADTITKSTLTEKERMIGLVAQEVEMVVPEVVKTMHDGSKAVNYQNLVGLLIEAMKEQQLKIETLQNNLNNQEKEIQELKNGVNTPNITINNLPQGNSTAKLYENIPNPFSIDTKIQFYIPEGATSVRLLIHNMQGQEIKSYNIAQTGEGSYILKGSELEPGMYMYSLLIDRKIIDTKRMLLTKE